MNQTKRIALWINIVGGIAVLLSYAHGIVSHPITRSDVWGGVPDALRPLYTTNMFLAATGYFAFSYFVFFKLDAENCRIGNLFGFGIFNLLYALILIPSAMWMPLTFAMLEAPSSELWLGIRITLGLVGIGSLGLLAAIVAVDSQRTIAARWPAAIGCGFFCLQTAVLDALIWPAYFPQ
jgi:hypothetical protein